MSNMWRTADKKTFTNKKLKTEFVFEKKVSTDAKKEAEENAQKEAKKEAKNKADQNANKEAEKEANEEAEQNRSGIAELTEPDGAERNARTQESKILELRAGRDSGEAHDNSGKIPPSYHGIFNCEIKWNGDHIMEVRNDCLVWKKQLVEVEWDDEHKNAKGTVLVPHQTSEWKKGKVGLTERFDIRFNGPSASSGFQGRFQREGEGDLPITGTFTKASE